MDCIADCSLKARQLGLMASLLYTLLSAILVLVSGSTVPESQSVWVAFLYSIHPWFYLLVSSFGVYWLVNLVARRLLKGEIALQPELKTADNREDHQFDRLLLTTDLLLESSIQGIFGMDPEGRVSFVNPALCRLLGYKEEDLLGRHYRHFTAADPVQAQTSNEEPCPLQRSLDEQTAVRGESRYLRSDGHRLPVEFTCCPLREEAALLGAVVFFLDTSERKQAEERQFLAMQVFESTLEGQMVTDADVNIVAVNPGFTRITGYRQEEVIGARPSILKSDRHDADFYREMWASIEHKGHWGGEIYNRHKDGNIYPEWLYIIVVRNTEDEVTHYVGSFTDTSALKTTEAKLHHLAHHDALTGLPNRILFNDRLHQALSRAEREAKEVGILFLDLDHFKHVNDSLGHPVGDEMLCQVAQRLRTLLRKEDTVARLGGDEFIVLLEKLDEPGAAATVAGKMEAAFAEPFMVAGRELFAGVSIGISLYPSDGADAATLVKNADASMYRAKELGRNNYQFYTEDMTQTVNERVRLESELRHALGRGQLSLVYQPQVSLFGNTGMGAEVLLRWHHPTLGEISPARFITVAEETGLILPIGEWVLLQACTQAMRWLQQGLPLRRIAVNISGIQVRRGDFTKTVRQVLEQTGLPSHHLELEITESYIMGQSEQSIDTLLELKKLGISLAIDDFGTGSSSLSYLRRLPVDRIKIDRSFLLGLPDAVHNGAIAAAIVALAHSLQLSVVAEGVETLDQEEFLENLGCEQAQGHLYSWPLPPDEFPGFQVSVV